MDHISNPMFSQSRKIKMPLLRTDAGVPMRYSAQITLQDQ
jgi:hypothetical protein